MKKEIEDLFQTMAQQFIMLIESNNKLLIENLRLMKENEGLRKNQIEEQK